jgi:hypothetical protein
MFANAPDGSRRHRRSCGSIIPTPIDVPLDLLDQTTCLHPLEHCQILIEHHVALANDQSAAGSL